MAFELINFQSSQIKTMAVEEILECNNTSSKFGLVLSREDVGELVEVRTESLKANGRVEFGGGVIETLIYEFCDSPYINKQNYTETLNELIEIFYYYKNETFDMVPDDILIQYMKKAFNGSCCGSLKLLSERELYKLTRKMCMNEDEDEEEESEESSKEDDYE